MITAASLFTISLVSYLQPPSTPAIRSPSTARGSITPISAVASIDGVIPYPDEQFSHRSFSSATTSSPIFEFSPPSAADPTISQNHDTSRVS